jgi:AbrB family looped-hinge helix DNA binding protein
MPPVRSKLTARFQTTVPAEIRKRLGLRPGSTLEWSEKPEGVVVRQVGPYTSEDVHRALFPSGPPRPKTLEELREGIREYVRATHPRPSGERDE